MNNTIIWEEEKCGFDSEESFLKAMSGIIENLNTVRHINPNSEEGQTQRGESQSETEEIKPRNDEIKIRKLLNLLGELLK